MINFLKYKLIYLLLSCIVILPGVFFLATRGLRPSIDFTGGTIVEYKFGADVTEEKITLALGSKYEIKSIEAKKDSTFLLKLSHLEESKTAELRKTLTSLSATHNELRLETVGPVLGKELLAKTLTGLLLATVFILLYIATAFKDIKFGICATIATFHDSLVILGLFAIFGVVFGVEVDALFVTALLTVLSFSVHDTIVVFHRIREYQNANRSMSLEEIANRALNETMVRSLNNSLTIIFMLTALLLLGGESIRWFVVALLIGTVSGTYSSPFVATPLLVMWDKLFKKRA